MPFFAFSENHGFLKTFFVVVMAVFYLRFLSFKAEILMDSSV